MSLRILLVGGGTGGHVFPLTAVAEELGAGSGNKPGDTKIYFMGSGELIAEESRKLNAPCYRIAAPKWRRYLSAANFIDLLKVPVAFFQSLLYVWFIMPDVVFSKGGYSSFFPLLAAKILFIPIVIHESDSVPGFVNKVFGHFSKRIFLGFQSAVKFFNPRKCQVVGVPMRPEVLEQIPIDDARAVFGFKNTNPVLYIGGGSQGAQALNDVLMLSVIKLIEKFNIIHQTGASNYSAMQRELGNIIAEQKSALGPKIQEGYALVSQLSARQLAAAYSTASLAVIRSGSQAFEIAARGIPMILVPLASAAANHQFFNAMEIARFGATIISQDNLQPHILLNEIQKTFSARDELSKKILAFAKSDASRVIANYLKQS